MQQTEISQKIAKDLESNKKDKSLATAAVSAAIEDFVRTENGEEETKAVSQSIDGVQISETAIVGSD